MNHGFDFLSTAMTKITDSLTKVRSIAFVRRLQFVLIFITLVAVISLLSRPFMGRPKINTSPEGEYFIGKESPETVISSMDIFYDDMEKTELARQKAEQSVHYHFDKDYTVLSNIIEKYISDDFEELKKFSIESKNVNTLRETIPRWRNRTNEELKLLVDFPRKDKLKKSVSQFVNSVFSKYCILKEPLPEDQILKQLGGRIYNLGKKDIESYHRYDEIIPRQELYRNPKVVENLNQIANDILQGYSKEYIGVISKIGLYYLFSYPACNFNLESTNKAKNLARQKVDVIKSKISINQVVVRKGEVITPEIHTKLELINKHATRANLSSIVSLFIVQLVFVFIIATFLIKYNHKRLNDVSSNIVVFSLIWMILGTAFIVSRFYYDVESNWSNVYYFALFVPVGMVCMLIGFMYDEKLALAVGFYLSFFVYFSSQNNPTSLLIAISTSVAGAIYGTRIRKRIDFIKASFLLSFIQIVVSTSGYLYESRDYWVSVSTGSWIDDFLNSNITKLYILCIINGTLSSIAMQSLLPVYEYIFNIPTRFKLVELADTGHPLLQELLTKAPSTYTHTFLVAAMSERAAHNLGLDWLLTRVGVYFHDIGKIPNAGFFIENQHLIPKPENIDKNDPTKAAKVVIDHVLDGIEMAKKARLPREVISFIPEHHGTSTMAFFYHKALSSLPVRQRRKISKSDFQYPGPKPQSKETAIVMLADSLEAASRSLDEVTEESLDNLIQKIINSKLAENQLDESGLTIGDLEVIKRSFKEVLLSSLHQRPKYPKPEETKELEKKNIELKKNKNTSKNSNK